MTHGIDSQAHRRPDGQCTARARGALGVRHPAPQQVRVELMLQGDPCDRHARTHALGNHRRLELVRVPTAPNPTLGNLSLDSVHVSTSFLVDIMLLVATTRYKMSSLAAYQAEAIQTARVQQIHRVDDEGRIGGVLSTV